MAEIFDILRFEVDKSQDLTMSEAYQEIANVTLLEGEVGTYEFGASMVHTFDSITTSVYRRVSIDGGVTWKEFVLEPSDITNNIGGAYFFFAVGIEGDLNMIVEARKETAAGTLIIEAVDAYIRRVK